MFSWDREPGSKGKERKCAWIEYCVTCSSITVMYLLTQTIPPPRLSCSDEENCLASFPMLREGTGHARIQTQVPLYERGKWAHSGTLEGPNKCSEIAPSPVLPSYSFFHPKEFTTVGCGQCHFRLCARPTVGSLALWIRNDTFSELSSSCNNLLCHEDALGSWWPACSHHDGTRASSGTCFKVSANVESATEHPSPSPYQSLSAPRPPTDLTASCLGLVCLLQSEVLRSNFSLTF